MTNELARLDGGVLVRDEWTDERKDLVRRMYCKGASDEEFDVFVETCRRTGLSPLMKQIYCVMRKQDGKPQMTIQVGIDGFRLIADRTGCYVPGREATFGYDEKGKLSTATAYVKKLVGGSWHEVAATVRWDEFAAGGSFWQGMPHHQLSKVAEAHALRRAFPADLSGLYTQEEMDQADRMPPAAPPSRARVSEPRPAALPAAEVLPPEDVERDSLIRRYGAAKARAKVLGITVKALQREMPNEEIAAHLELLELAIQETEAKQAQEQEAAA